MPRNRSAWPSRVPRRRPCAVSATTSALMISHVPPPEARESGGRGPAAPIRVVPSRSTGVVTDQIIVGDRVLLASGFRAARARLEILTRDEVLTCASEVAYGAGITALVEA